MAIIHLLDNETINKIAAGEVIENPRSIVKELVENSIDASADEIIVEIKNGGKSLIRITDNGKGIENKYVEDAFKRHFTSKINYAEDLGNLTTLGFRGEALASIAAVSKVELITRTTEDIYGTKVIIEGGQTLFKGEIGCPVGTTIVVTDLFFNVPARKKFLKSDIQESSLVNETVEALALSKKNISFKYINNNKILFKTPKTNNMLNVISSVYESDLYNSLIEVNYSNSLIKITGYTTNLNYYRGNRKLQMVFINGRCIKHKRINYFLEAAYETMLPKNKYPAVFINIEIEPNLVDVNVHPAKTEVRFQNENLVLNEVKQAIYSSLSSVNIIKQIKSTKFTKEDKEDTNYNQRNVYDFEKQFSNKKSIFAEDLYHGLEQINQNNNQESYNIFEEVIENSSIIEEVKENSFVNTNIEIKQTSIEYHEEKDLEDKFESASSGEIVPELRVVGIIMDTYIICEDTNKMQMFMIDQHAAHERINYEKFLAQYKDNNILSQELLVPEVINLSYNDYNTAIDNIELFYKLGFKVENFGINAILINSIPSVFKNSKIIDVFFSIIDNLKSKYKDNLDLNFNYDKIIKEACVMAVKSGDKLHSFEIEALIKNLRKTKNPYTCPHGRPVIIKITRYEIERMFERIQY